MKRREFLGRGLVGLGSLGALAALAPSCRPRASRRVKARNLVWVGGPGLTTEAAVRKQIGPYREAGMTGLCVSSELLEHVLPAAVEEGYEVQAWTWIMCQPDQKTVAGHPGWYMVNRKGESCVDKPPYVGYYRWLCPNKPEVRAFLLEKMRALASYDGVSTIQLDYIRYPDVILPVGVQPEYRLVQDGEMPEYDYCYCPECRRLFKDATGLDPLSLADPAANAEWRAFRLKSVTSLAAELTAEIRGRGKRVSADVFPTPEIAARLVRQDWPRWDLDDVFAMTYNKYYNEKAEWVGRAARLDRKALAGRKTSLFCSLLFNTMPDADVRTAVRGAFENGADGISIFGGIAPKKRDLLRQALAEFNSF